MGRPEMLFLLVLVALAPGAPVAAAGGMPRWGLELTGSEARLTNDLAGGAGGLENAFRPGWGAGVTGEWTLSRRWSLVSGMRYLRIDEHESYLLEVSYPGGTVTGSADDRTHWHWLGIPLVARVAPWPRTPISLDFGAEPRVLVAARARSDVSLPATPLSAAGVQRAPTAQIFEGIRPGEWYDATGFYRRVDMALAGGVGAGFDLRGHPTRIRLGYSYGLPDLRKTFTAKRHSQIVELGLGWSW